MDTIYRDFLKTQFEEGMALASQSDLLRLYPIDGPIPQKYIAQFSSKGLVRDQNGSVSVAESWEIGISFFDDYLRRADTFTLLTWLSPINAFHGSIRPPFICIGHVVPATGLVEVLYRVFDVIGYNRVTMLDQNALNIEACAWARQNKNRFPVERRALKRVERSAREPAQNEASRPAFDIQLLDRKGL